MPEVLSMQLLEKIQIDSVEHLDGRILQLLGTWKLKNVDLWLQIEEFYSQKIEKEDSFKLIEALVGLG